MLVPVLRPLTLGETLDTSFGVYRSLFAPLLSVSVVTQAVPLALGAYAEASGGWLTHQALWVATLILSLLLGYLGTAATTFLVAEAYLGGGLTMQQAFRRATSFIGPLIVASLLTAIVVGMSATAVMLVAGALSLKAGSSAPLVLGAGAVVSIFIAIAIFCALVVTTPTMVLEGTRKVTAAMGRSVALTRGHRLRIFLSLFIVVLLLLIPTSALSGLAIAVGKGEKGSPAVVGILLVASILQILIYPFIYVLLTVLYYDLRVRKEGFDLEMLATSLQPA
jgi:multisubunit Na+/H+ antiporter MnhC subunit